MASIEELAQQAATITPLANALRQLIAEVATLVLPEVTRPR